MILFLKKCHNTTPYLFYNKQKQQQFFFPVVSQSYTANVMDESVLKGNTAIFKCHIPSFVSDYVYVTSWLRDDGHEILLANEMYGAWLINFKILIIKIVFHPYFVALTLFCPHCYDTLRWCLVFVFLFHLALNNVNSRIPLRCSCWAQNLEEICCICIYVYIYLISNKIILSGFR